MGSELGLFSPLVAKLVGLSGALLIAGILLTPLLVARIPADYFIREEPPAAAWVARHPLLGALLRVLKNVLGALIFLAGILMLVLPGQGVMAILVGLTLVEFPGKRRLELGILRRGPVLKAINWIRAKAHRAPLLLPP
jgi:hypothetical protein